jgi:hypothetical protein
MAAVAAFSFLSGGYVIGRSTPVAVALLCGAAVWVWFLRRSTRLPFPFLVALGLFAAFTLWSGISVLWSFGPDLTWVSFNLTAFYLAVVTVLGLTSVRGLQLRTVGHGYLVVATAVALWAFLGKATPEVVTHAHTWARLSSPIGYWNVLALMMVIGLCVALSLAGDRCMHAGLRTAAAAAAVPMSLTFFFSFSRGGWIVLAVALLLYFCFTTTRLASFVSLVVIAVPVGLVLWRLRGLETLFTETTDDALRALQGGELLRWSIAVLLVVAGLQLVAALAQGAVRWPRWSTVAAGVVVLAILAAVAVGGSARFLEPRGGFTWVQDRVHELLTDAAAGSAYPTSGPGRLISLNTGRPELWREASHQSRHDRVSGTGAGTFPFTHYRFRETGGVVRHAHSQWFNVLTELGVVGLGFYAAAMALLLAAAVGNPFSRRRDPLHPLLVAMQAGVVAFFVHLSWDWDWDMAAAGTLVFVFIAACMSYRTTRTGDERRAGRRTRETPVEPAVADAAPPERGEEAAEDAPAPQSSAPRGRRVGWGPRVVASAALLLLAASWLPPYLSHRASNAALAESGEGDVVAALGHARRAADLDPLAVDPLLIEASLLQQVGRNREALARLRAAAELQPENYRVWYELGVVAHETFGREDAARAAFVRALGLNPLDAASRYELDLVGR